MLLTIDPARLADAEVRVEAVGRRHLPARLRPDQPHARWSTSTPLDRRGGTETVTSLWIKGMAVRMGIALAVMVLVAVVVLVVQQLG